MLVGNYDEFTSEIMSNTVYMWESVHKFWKLSEEALIFMKSLRFLPEVSG